MSDYVIYRTENGWTVFKKIWDSRDGLMYQPVSPEYEDLEEAKWEFMDLSSPGYCNCLHCMIAIWGYNPYDLKPMRDLLTAPKLSNPSKG